MAAGHDDTRPPAGDPGHRDRYSSCRKPKSGDRPTGPFGRGRPARTGHRAPYSSSTWARSPPTPPDRVISRRRAVRAPPEGIGPARTPRHPNHRQRHVGARHDTTMPERFRHRQDDDQNRWFGRRALAEDVSGFWPVGATVVVPSSRERQHGPPSSAGSFLVTPLVPRRRPRRQVVTANGSSPTRIRRVWGCAGPRC